MVPSVFVAMETLPRTPNGKTDRLRLPAVEGIRPEMAVPFSPPGTPTEETLARLWAEALGLDRVGVHDDFFELGGDSLLALKLLSRIEQTFQTPLSLKELLQAPTIAGQSARVVDGRDTPTRVSLVEVRRPADASEASRPPLVVGPTLFGHVGEWRELVQGPEFDRAVVRDRVPRRHRVPDGATDARRDCFKRRGRDDRAVLRQAGPSRRPFVWRSRRIRARPTTSGAKGRSAVDRSGRCPAPTRQPRRSDLLISSRWRRISPAGSPRSGSSTACPICGNGSGDAGRHDTRCRPRVPPIPRWPARIRAA